MSSFAYFIFFIQACLILSAVSTCLGAPFGLGAGCPGPYGYGAGYGGAGYGGAYGFGTGYGGAYGYGNGIGAPFGGSFWY